MSLPPCPQCASEYTYEDGGQYICPECAHEWNETESAADLAVEVRDANGSVLQNGDTVILIKDLKVKGSSMVIKSKAYACKKAITTSAVKSTAAR